VHALVNLFSAFVLQPVQFKHRWPPLVPAEWRTPRGLLSRARAYCYESRNASSAHVAFRRSGDLPSVVAAGGKIWSQSRGGWLQNGPPDRGQVL